MKKGQFDGIDPLAPKVCPLNLPGHRPRTRRDFLAQGFIGFSAMATLPTFAGFGMRQALASVSRDEHAMPFLAFDMAGGGALPANFLVGGQGGPDDLLTSYTSLGWDPRRVALNREFGLPMATDVSKLLVGILANTSAAARANFRMGSFCHFGQDDTSSNKLSSSALVLSSGAMGVYISNGLGTVNSLSGGNSDVAMGNASLKPTFVQSVTDVLGATNFGTGADLAAHHLRALAKGSNDLGLVQAQNYLGRDGGDVLKQLSEIAYAKSLELVNGVTGLDPREDADVRSVYNIAQNSDPTDPNAIAAAISMNAIKGFSGPSVWTLGGCDYHDGTQTTGDARDSDMGIQIGRAVELAYRLQKPLFFQLLTDGGCDSSPGTRQWRGDSGDKSMTVIGFYHPQGAPKYVPKAGSGDPTMQIGHYTSGQGAERSTLIGGDPRLVACAVFANYLSVTNQLARFHDIVPGIFTGAGELDSVLIFSGEIG